MTAIIDSSSGLQGLVVSPEPLQHEEAEDLMKRMAHAAGLQDGIDTDAGHKIDRIIRLPGTLNWPSTSKVEKKGYPKEPSLESILDHNPERRSNLEAIRALQLPEPKTREMTAQHAQAGDNDYTIKGTIMAVLRAGPNTMDRQT